MWTAQTLPALLVILWTPLPSLTMLMSRSPQPPQGLLAGQLEPRDQLPRQDRRLSTRLRPQGEV